MLLRYPCTEKRAYEPISPLIQAANGHRGGYRVFASTR